MATKKAFLTTLTAAAFGSCRRAVEDKPSTSEDAIRGEIAAGKTAAAYGDAYT